MEYVIKFRYSTSQGQATLVAEMSGLPGTTVSMLSAEIDPDDVGDIKDQREFLIEKQKMLLPVTLVTNKMTNKIVEKDEAESASEIL